MDIKSKTKTFQIELNLGIIKFKFRKLFKSTLNNRLHRNLACVIDKSSRGAKLERAFEELPSNERSKKGNRLRSPELKSNQYNAS